MSSFEQKAPSGAVQVLKAAGKKPKAGVKYAYIEDIGNKADVRRQQRLYGRLGYGVAHSDETGIVMEINRSDDEARRAASRKVAKDRLHKPQAAELPKEEGNTAQVSSVALGNFMDTDDTSD